MAPLSPLAHYLLLQHSLRFEVRVLCEVTLLFLLCATLVVATALSHYVRRPVSSCTLSWTASRSYAGAPSPSSPMKSSSSICSCSFLIAFSAVRMARARLLERPPPLHIMTLTRHTTDLHQAAVQEGR